MQEATILRQLIADNQNKEAAERLYQWFEGKSASRQDAALALLNRIKALDDQVLGGLIAQADAELERNRITKALLELSKQLEETGEPTEQETGSGSKAWIYGVVAILAAGMLYLALDKSDKPAAPPEFTLTTHLYWGAGTLPVTEGKIKLILGDYHLPPKDINSEGEVVFANIDGRYFHDTIRMVPVGSRYRILSQSAKTPRESQNITFKVEQMPDTTIVKGVVYLPGTENLPAAGAELTFDFGKGVGVTDGNGRFEIPVFSKPEKLVKLVIRYQDKQRYNKVILVPWVPIEITLNP